MRRSWERGPPARIFENLQARGPRSHVRLLAILLSPFSLLLSPVARSATFDLPTASIADINAAVTDGALTSEKLISLYLARIAAYDKRGPMINAIISLNPNALAEARALDAERRTRGPRSPLHGIPVVLKDNIDSVGLPDTGGSLFLADNLPAEDAFVVKGLRDAGAIILAKVNLGDFASDASGRSSIGGQTRNPHNPLYSPVGSSGGSGAALGAWFAPLALGTDTGGSLRSPTSVHGIVGLKPTNGLLSRGGNIPCVFAFDTPGPMARNVYDLAVSLGAMTGVDPKDPLTRTSLGLAHRDYTPFLRRDALRGARVGVLRDAMGQDDEVDALFNAAVADLAKLGAVLVNPVSYPPLVLQLSATIMKVVGDTDVPEQFDAYLSTVAPGRGFPKNLAEMVQRADAYLASRPDKTAPFPGIYARYKERLVADGPPPTASLAYRSAKEHGMATVRAAALGLFEAKRLDALVYVTRPQRPPLITLDDPKPTPNSTTTTAPKSLSFICNVTGFPDLIVPAGLTSDRLPVSISFVGPPYSEPQLLALAYAYEQATHHRVNASATPPLPGETFTY